MKSSLKYSRIKIALLSPRFSKVYWICHHSESFLQMILLFRNDFLIRISVACQSKTDQSSIMDLWIDVDS